MSGTRRIALAACGAAWEAAALAEIDRSPGIELVRRCVDVADLLATAATHRLDGALVSVVAPGLDAGVVERLAERGVEAVAVEADGGHLGIRSSVRLGGLGSWSRSEAAGPVERPDAGTVIAVWGPTGAPGRSSLAISLAAALSARRVRTALVDADVHGGSIAQWLAILDDVSGLMAACRDANRGLTHTADEHLVAVDPDLHVLTGLPRSDMWHHVRPTSVEAVLQHLAMTHGAVVVDCGFDAQVGTGPMPGQVTRRVLDVADTVVAVGRVDPIGLARLVRALSDAGPWTRPPRLVLNGFRTSLGWTEREVTATVRELTGLTPWVFLPVDPAGHDAAMISGRPLREVAPTSGYVARVERLVADLGLAAESDRTGRRGRSAAR